MHREAFFILSLLGGFGCSLLAPSDDELIGPREGAGGNRGPDFGNGGESSAGERATSGDGGSGDSSGDNGQQAGSDGGDEAGTSVGGADAGASSGGSESTTGGNAAGASTSGGEPAGGSTADGGTSDGGTSDGGTSGGGTSGGGTSDGGSTAVGGTTGGAALGGGGVGLAGGGSAGQTSGGRGGAAGGNAGGTGGSVLHCSPNPCVRGTCSEVSGGYKCTCPAGWGGSRCETGSCATLTCPASAPCRVPKASVVAVCYPSACSGSVGLCMAENTNGSGDAIIIEGRNADFNPLMGGNWRNRARYFAYLDNAHGSHVCVFPQLSEQGTPLAIPLGEVRTKAAGFGQSNSWPNPPTCSAP